MAKALLLASASVCLLAIHVQAQEVALSAGTRLHFLSNQRLCGDSAKVGDIITARLADTSAAEAAGHTVLRGASLTLIVTAVDSSRSMALRPVLNLAAVSIAVGDTVYRLDAATDSVHRLRKYERSRSAPVLGATTKQKEMVVPGTSPRRKSTAEKVLDVAASMSVANSAAQAANRKSVACVDTGAVVIIRLNAPVRIRG